MSGLGKHIQHFHERGFSISRDTVSSWAVLVTCLPSSSWGSRALGSPQALGRMKAFCFPTFFLHCLGHGGLKTCLLPTPHFLLITHVPLWVLKRFSSWQYYKTDDNHVPSSQLCSSVFTVSLPSSRHQKQNLTTAGSWAPATWKDLLPWFRSFVLVFVRAPLPPEGQSLRMGSLLRFSLTLSKNYKGHHFP